MAQWIWKERKCWWPLSTTDLMTWQNLRKKKRRGEQKTNNETSVTLRFRQTASKLWAPWVDTSIEHHFFEKRPLKLANPEKLLSSHAWMIQWTSHRSLGWNVPFSLGLSDQKMGHEPWDFYAPKKRRWFFHTQNFKVPRHHWQIANFFASDTTWVKCSCSKLLSSPTLQTTQWIYKWWGSIVLEMGKLTCQN